MSDRAEELGQALVSLVSELEERLRRLQEVLSEADDGEPTLRKRGDPWPFDGLTPEDAYKEGLADGMRILARQALHQEEGEE